MVEKGWVAGVLGDIPHVINLPKYQGSLSCLGCLNLVSIGGDPQRAAINDGWFCRLCPSTCLDDNKGALFTFRIPDQEEIGSWLPRFLFKLHTPWFPTHLPIHQLPSAKHHHANIAIYPPGGRRPCIEID